MRRAAVVMTISQTSKDELRKWVGPLADKVVVVPDCVFGEFSYDPKSFNQRSPLVLQIGTKWNKNVERVIEAVKGTGCRLEIVGELSEEQKASHGNFSHGLTRITEDLFRAGDTGPKSSPQQKQSNQPLSTTVKELGRLTDEELVQAYRRCDMVVFASLYEGFGLPILEAQATGRPVITSNFGAMKEAAGEGALLADPYSVEAIRGAVLRIKNEPALREELVRKGRENVNRFRPEAVAMKYAEIYRKLATGGARRRQHEAQPKAN
jgi:glycosyltransferase involved in cell wall biosynthesis